ncbi:MAG TPA: hypothetical protein VGY31_00805 [Terriglobia bacterium]|nr:hypothetical protein [Terriglobia bacterium]
MAIYKKPVNGMGEEQLLDKTASGGTGPTDWSRDGRYVLEKPAGSTLSIRVLPLSPGQAGDVAKAFVFLRGAFNATMPGFRLMANESHTTRMRPDAMRYLFRPSRSREANGRCPQAVARARFEAATVKSSISLA